MCVYVICICMCACVCTGTCACENYPPGIQHPQLRLEQRSSSILPSQSSKRLIQAPPSAKHRRVVAPQLCLRQHVQSLPLHIPGNVRPLHVTWLLMHSPCFLWQGVVLEHPMQQVHCRLLHRSESVSPPHSSATLMQVPPTLEHFFGVLSQECSWRPLSMELFKYERL